MELKTLDISFCSKNALNLVNSEAKQYIMDALKDNYGIDSKYKYANIINKNSLNYLAKQPHLISIKTGGSNYFLFLTKLNGINTTLFIDRKVKQGYTLPRIISTKYRFKDELFEDTLFDGELVKDTKDNWMFLISNIIVYKGKNINKSDNIVTKYNKIYSILSDEYTSDPMMDVCPIRVKKLFRYNERH